jgi:hypothetical protein
MYIFNADATMQQASPDAGDPHSSDSEGKGVWITDDDRIKGKWVEVTADRPSHKFKFPLTSRRMSTPSPEP